MTMRLAPRLVLAFGFVAALSVTGLGWKLRQDRVESETQRFEHEVHAACDRIVAEIARQAESDRKLVAGACQSGELVDRALIWVEAGLDDPRRLALSRLVPEERRAFDLDELILATLDGEPLGADPVAIVASGREHIASVLSGDVQHFRLRRSPDLASSVACLKRDPAGHAVGLVGARRLKPLADRLARIFDVQAALEQPLDGTSPASPGRGRNLDGTSPASPGRGRNLESGEHVARASCTIADAAKTELRVFVDKPTGELDDNLARIDRNVLYAGFASTGVALLLAVLLARSLGGPISELAREARKVASGEARPLAVHGPREIAELAESFDKMLLDLEATRERLAAASRVAAWREVARSVAHEVKNPLAPIRAAVETLRRLRARGAPEFDEYFDEATRTVLAEVHRISNIVTEFTRFARLPAPKPESSDLGELARQVVRMHESNAAGAKLSLVVRGSPPTVLADRDQIVQLLTNLVQNAIEAVGQGDGEVLVTVEPFTVAPAKPGTSVAPAKPGTEAEHVSLTVSDNGPGIAPQVASHLFDPYVTTKARGTGLGLAIAQRIAIEHAGELTCVPAPGGRGAAFRLVLPVAGPPGGGP
jgi:signal transduction histidine kinase